jgi:SET domain-containing protein
MKIISIRKFKRMHLLCSKKDSLSMIKERLGHSWNIIDKRPVHKLLLLHYQGKLRTKNKEVQNKLKDPLKIMKSYFILVCERPW